MNNKETTRPPHFTPNTDKMIPDERSHPKHTSGPEKERPRPTRRKSLKRVLWLAGYLAGLITLNIAIDLGLRQPIEWTVDIGIALVLTGIIALIYPHD